MKQETIKIKNSWKEVTIEDFLKIQRLDIQDFETELDYHIELLSILSDKDKEYLYTIPVVNIPSLLSEIEFISSMPKGEIKYSYLINGKKYKATLNVNDLTAMQYIDLVSLLTDNKDNKNIHLILAVILIEEGKEYNAKNFDIEKAADEIKQHFNIADAWQISVFFSTLLNSLMVAIGSYSASKMKKLKKKEKNPKRREAIKKAMAVMETFHRGGVGSIT